MLKRFIPPIVIDAARALRGRDRSPQQFESWEEAAKACGPGYDDAAIARIVAAKTEAYQRRIAEEPLSPGDLSLLAAVGMIGGKSKLVVLDVGGAIGAHHHLVRHAFPGLELDWRIVETPAMVEEGRGAVGSMRFYRSISAAHADGVRFDLVFSSGTLQCVADPYGMLREMLSLGAPLVLLQRMGVVEGPREVVTVHEHALSLHGRGPAPAGFPDGICRYPFRFLRKDEFEAAIRETYAITSIAPDPSGVFPVGSINPIGITYFCRRRVG
jgi:putative methyltransferase (TIGR04325 family)